MDTANFFDDITPDALFNAFDPTPSPFGAEAECARHHPTRFPSSHRQQAAFDGEPVEPDRDLPAARAICYSCPLLAACRRFAADSLDEFTFLAGRTSEQRRVERNKQAEIAQRRRQVRELHALGAPTGAIADLVRRDPSLIRGDLRAIEKAERPAAAM